MVSSPTNSLPTPLLRAISSTQGGKVTLVIGASCISANHLHSRPSSTLSAKIYAKLIDDELMPADSCEDPTDLSAVAKAVKDVTGSQAALVEAFPRNEFRSAQPNAGRLNAAALLLEGAISDIMGLNFDLALSTAIARLGGGSHVTIISGPESYQDLGRSNLIYLHRNVECDDFDEWIITTEALQEKWAEDKWETVVTRRCTAVPVVVFAGLGSRAEVFRAIGPTNSKRYLEFDLPCGAGRSKAVGFLRSAGPARRQPYFRRVGHFMAKLSERVAKEHRRVLLDACDAQLARGGWQFSISSRIKIFLGNLDLLSLGELRASWSLDAGDYNVSWAAMRSTLQIYFWRSISLRGALI